MEGHDEHETSRDEANHSSALGTSEAVYPKEMGTERDYARARHASAA